MMTTSAHEALARLTEEKHKCQIRINRFNERIEQSETILETGTRSQKMAARNHLPLLEGALAKEETRLNELTRRIDEELDALGGVDA